MEQADHFQSGLGTFDSLIPDIPARTMDRLFHAVASQNSKRDGHPGTGSQLSEHETDRSIDVLIMRGFAPNHSAQAKHGRVLVGLDQMLGRQRDFPCPRNPGDVDLVLADAGSRERFGRAGQEL